MRNRYINLILILLLIGLNIISTIDIDNIKFADAREDKFSSMIGVKQVIANNVDTTYTGRNFVDAKGKIQYEYKAIISQAPIYNNDGSLVDCSWHFDGKTYSVINNIFSVTVTNSAISTTHNGQTMSWNPIVMVDSKEYVAKGSPKVLAVDPINSNYQNNVLEWDYGVCVRRVRVIEGMIQETWIFDKDPKGTVWIKDNAQKSAGFTWAIAPYAFDANNNAIPINQYKQVMASDLAKATYPVTIDPTEVYYTSASDGYIQATSVTYATVWAAATGTVYNTGIGIQFGQYTGYGIRRAYLYFNTTALPDSATVTAANVSLRGYADYSTTDFNISITNGQPTYPHNPLEVGDFAKGNYSGIGNAGFNTAGYSTSYMNISMNSTGWSWINVSNWTKLCIRSYEDIIASAPAADEFIAVYSYEKGAGYRPYLEVTYVTAGTVYLTTSSGSGGNVSTPGEGTYAYNTSEVVNISATADACYHFVNWTGNTSNIGNVNASSTNISMGTVNKTATANFVINTSTITYIAGANGTLNNSTPQTINCGTYTTYVLASPNASCAFVNWSDSSTTNPRRDLGTSTNQSFTANFRSLVLSISNTPDSKSFGFMLESTSYWSNGSAPIFALNDSQCFFAVTNNGDIASITINATNFTGGVGWALNLTVDVNKVVMKAGKSGDANEGAMVTLNSSPQAFITSLAASATKKWEIKLATGTFTDGVPKSSTITLVATLD